MTPALKKIVSKFKTVDEKTAIEYSLIHIKEILKIPIFWVEKGSQAESQFGTESTEEHWQCLKKEIEQIQKHQKS